MVRFKLHKIMADKGPGRPYKIVEVARQASLQPNTVSGIYNNKARRIDLDTIDALCGALKCKPSDLFEVSAETLHS